MRLVFYIIIFSQLVSLLGVFAEKSKNESYQQYLPKWQKVKDNKAENLKEIIWKSYNNDESYFQNENRDNIKIKKIKHYREENAYKSKSKSIDSITEIEPFLPLNNFLNYRDFKSSVRWKSSFDGGVSGGTGQQNPSFVFDYGISNFSLLSFYITGADDDLYNLVDGKKINYYWQSYALSYKRQLLDENKYNFGLSIASTFEYWRHASGSETSKSIFNQKDDSYGKDNFENIVGALSLPISKNVNKNFTILIVPGITFLPDKLGTKGIGKNAYGNNFYIGSGFVLDIAKDVNLLFSYTTPLGPGYNYFDSDLNYSRKSIYSLGLGWDINPRIGVEGKITNSYGASPATGLLTIPSDDLLLYSANFIYKPYEEDTFLNPLNEKDKLINYGGISVSNALIPPFGTSQINLNYDKKGNSFGSYSYSLSNIFQLELINIGTFKDINISGNNNASLHSTYLSNDNLNYRLGGKLLIFSPQKDDHFWMALRTSVGRNNETNQGYLFNELINTFKFNDWFAFNISSKYLSSGIESFGGFGLSSYINLLDNIQLIPEINSSFNKDSDFNATLALRYSYLSEKSVDLYYSNAVGIQDIGQLLKDKDYRFGIKLNFLY